MKLRRSSEADESLQIFKRSVTVDPGPDGTGEGPQSQGWGSDALMMNPWSSTEVAARSEYT